MKYTIQKLTQMYTDDPRFSAYYEKVRPRPGAAGSLRDAIHIYVGFQQ